MRKAHYTDRLQEDSKGIRRLKRELEDQKVTADQEIDDLATELKTLKAEQLSNKESTKSLN